MSSPRREDGPPKLRWPEDIDEIFGRANPNPTREGCPPREELIALARKERPVSDPGYVHLTRCSPCYLEVRDLQRAHIVQRRQRLLMLAVAALVVLAVGLGLWLMINRGVQVADLRADLDLRPYALMRSAPADSSPPPLELQRARLTLTMILPVGFEPGMYEVQILDSELMSRASAPGAASSENFVTTLRTVLDLSSLSAGTYQLALRRIGQEWQLFPALVR